MKFEFSGAMKVFSFTFKNQVKSKGFKALTLILSLLLIVLPALIMPLIEMASDEKEEATGLLSTVYIADNASLEDVDFSLLNSFTENEGNIRYVYCKGGLDEASSMAQADPTSLILVTEEGSPLSVNVLMPEDTKLNDSDLTEYGYFISSSFSYLLLIESGVPIGNVIEIMNSVTLETPDTDVGDTEISEEEFAVQSFKEIASFVLPYLNIMLLYFMILAYGQSVANSLVLEKSSKLIEFFLLTMKPGAIILGKVTGIAMSAVVQLAAWIVSAVIGFGSGTLIVKSLNPDTDMILIKVFEAVGEYADIFSLSGLLLGILIIFAGFFLYCTIAAIGGSVAQKAEDLASTNSVFVLVLVFSFFMTLNVGSEDIMAYAAWHDFVPFTAILVTPSRLILGDTSLLMGALSLILIIAAIFAFAFIAGRLYKSMVFYKGNIPKIKDIISFIKK